MMNVSMIWRLAILLFLAAAPVANAQVSALDRQMLMAFYQSTNGTRWTTSTGWNGAAGTECSWFGVSCFNGAVTQLRLPDNNLGEYDGAHPFAFLLPVEPVNLRELTYLDLSGNRFEQIVPNSYGTFPKLILLDLSRMALSSALPAQLGQVTTLQYLYLNQNAFTGALPTSWSQLVNLRSLDLYDNALTGTLPSSWGSLTELRFLYLSDDPTTLQPDGALQGPIPASWGALVNLQTFSLDSNRIDGNLPSSMAQWTNIRSLTLDQNLIEGSLPEWIGAWTQLDALYLSNNRMSGPLPQALGQLNQLTRLSLFANQFTGTLPAGMANSSQLQTLLLQNNLIEGVFPSWLCELTTLKTLVLTSNRFTGGIPACIGQLTSLRKLGLGANALQGEVPTSLMQLTQLEILPNEVIDDGHLFFNALWTDDIPLSQFMYAHFPRGNTVPAFRATQTRAPINPSAEWIDADSVRLRWTPQGQTGEGRFQILGGPSDTLFCDSFDAVCVEPVVLAGSINVYTQDRNVNELVINGLDSTTRYRFIVLSVSEPVITSGPFLFFVQPNRLIGGPVSVFGVDAL